MMAVQTKYVRLKNGVKLVWTEKLAARPDAVCINDLDEEVPDEAYEVRTAVSNPTFEFLRQPGLRDALTRSLRSKKIHAPQDVTIKGLWDMFVASNKGTEPEAELANLPPPTPSESVIDAMQSRDELQACAKANFGVSFDASFDEAAIRKELKAKLKV